MGNDQDSGRRGDSKQQKEPSIMAGNVKLALDKDGALVYEEKGDYKKVTAKMLANFNLKFP